MMQFQLDQQSGEPMYRQLAGQLLAAINHNDYRAGERLPTEDMLVEATSLSKSTIRAAYAQLLALGVIQKIRGSGTYVSPKASLEEKTPEELTAECFRRLAQVRPCTMAQAYLLAKDCLDRACSDSLRVTAALVDCSMEVLHTTVLQLQPLKRLLVLPFLLGELESGRATVPPQCQLVLTTHNHFPSLAHLLASGRAAMEQIVLTESPETIAALTRIPAGPPVCVFYRSLHFLENVLDTLESLNKQNPVVRCGDSDVLDLDEELLIRRSPLIVPADYFEFSGPRALQIIERARKYGCRIIPYSFQIDGGSLIRLESRVRQLCVEGGASLGAH